jgi:hypothetical protein
MRARAGAIGSSDLGRAVLLILAAMVAVVAMSLVPVVGLTDLASVVGEGRAGGQDRVADHVAEAAIPPRAVPARAGVIDRSTPVESGRAWTGPAAIIPVLAVAAWCLVAGSSGAIGARSGRSATQLGRAPPFVMVTSTAR